MKVVIVMQLNTHFSYKANFLRANKTNKSEQKDFVMKPRSLKVITLLSIFFMVSNSQASLISYDLLAPNASTNISYSNQFTNAFSSSMDGFQIYQQDQIFNIPRNLLDKGTAVTKDSLGIVTKSNKDAFFGIVDTVNQDNTSSDAVATWQINIANLSAITFLADMAAMGDFESSDWFEWRYSVDNKPFTRLFQGITNDSTLQQYDLADGSSVTLFDPMTVNSTLLGNKFTTFASPNLTTGNLLTIELKAKVNGGSEVIAFQNVVLQAENNAVVVSEPTPFVLMLFALLFVMTNQPLSRRLKIN